MLGCFRYAQFVFVAEIFLAIYWIITLIYASVNDHEKLLPGLVFGLHYAGLIALCGLFDEVAKVSDAAHRSTKHNETIARTKRTIEVNRVRYVEGNRCQHHVSNGIGIAEADDPNGEETDASYENKLIEKMDRYPLAYGVALFVAMISDFFSLVEAILQHENHEIGQVTYYLYVVLFAIGLFLTLSSIVWSVVFYVKLKGLVNKISSSRADTSYVWVENV